MKRLSIRTLAIAKTILVHMIVEPAIQRDRDVSVFFNDIIITIRLHHLMHWKIREHFIAQPDVALDSKAFAADAFAADGLHIIFILASFAA